MLDCLGRRKQPYTVRINGASFELRPGTSDWWIFLEIFIFEIYREAMPQIEKAEVILDIGANVGMFAVYAASVNPVAKIHAFEPFPENVQQLKKNLSLSSQKQVQTHQAAVSDKSGVATLFFVPGDSSGCSLNQPGENSCSVETIAGNSLFEHCRIDKCDLLKMDCEGSELGILQSLTEDTLKRVGAVVMEYHDPKQIKAITSILARSGFKCRVIEPIHTIYAAR
ncbi:MAG TPA: FkbM family methyltransferase [Candidatus Paceibacterota bacterium]|nr:FkbM family methyltransferase [Candidatus Paceibacterota bacterium]